MLYLVLAGHATSNPTGLPAATVAFYALVLMAVAAVVGIVRDIEIDWADR